MIVIKRSGAHQNFDVNKIIRAITRANSETDKDQRMSEEQIQKVVDGVMKKIESFNEIDVDTIHKFIEKTLYSKNRDAVAREYIIFRKNKESKKKFNPIEEQVLAILNGNSDLKGDNANKDLYTNCSTRDYIAGITCKSILNKIYPKDVIDAHKKKLIHIHDTDYEIMYEANCQVSDLESMTTPGHTFVMGDTMIETKPNTHFSTVSNILSQIALSISSSQYGGQTQSWAQVAKFVDFTRQDIKKETIKEWDEFGFKYDEDILNKYVEKKVREDVYSGIKTYAYQIVSFRTANGQSPFISNNLNLMECCHNKQELNDLAMIIEEILRRRIKGLQDKSGRYVTPLFPKLLYWICPGLNETPDEPYYYLTELAAECIDIRMNPDIMSVRKSREMKNGQILITMGCRSSSPYCTEDNKYDISEKFYWIKRTNEPKAEFPYLTFVEPQTFESVENGTYKTGYEDGEYMINFRGNTGWLKEKTDEYVIIEKPIAYGRGNLGVITVNLPHVALEAVEKAKKTNEDVIKTFYEIFDERLEIVHKALRLRYDKACTITGKNAPIIWQYGSITSDLGPNDKVGDWLKTHPRRFTLSLGYAGIYETSQALIGKSNSTPEGQQLGIDILNYMNDACKKWQQQDENEVFAVYSLYGTPEEQLTYGLAMSLKRDFGIVENVSDHDYVTNSYHITPSENIDAFTKIMKESTAQMISSGGSISYIEVSSIHNNKEAILELINFMSHNIYYAEFNKMSGVCYKCGHVGDMDMTFDGEKYTFICPNCGNTNDETMKVTCRICGYLGYVSSGNVNKGRLADIYDRVDHTDCKTEWEEMKTKNINNKI